MWNYNLKKEEVEIECIDVFWFFIEIEFYCIHGTYRFSIQLLTYQQSSLLVFSINTFLHNS